MPSAPRRNASSPLFQYVCLAVLFASGMLFQIRYAIDIWHDMKVEIPFVLPDTASASLELVRPSAEKLGIHRSDTLVAINGKPYMGTSQLAEVYTKTNIGDQAIVTLRSSGADHPVAFAATTANIAITDAVYDVLLNIAAPIGCVLLGCWVVLVRPRDGLAWILLGLMFCFSQLLGSFKIESWGPGYREVAMAYRRMLAGSWPIFMFLFGFFFPEPFPYFVTRPFLKKWLPVVVIIPTLVDIYFKAWISIVEMTDYRHAHEIYQMYRPLENPLMIYIFCVVGFGFFTCISTKSATAISPDARRRLRLLYWGSSLALTPLFLLNVAGLIAHKSIYDMFPELVVDVSFLLTMLFPATMAYVIVVQRAMNVRVVVRQGLQYALAKNAIHALQIIAIGVVIATAFALGSNTNRAGKMVIIGVAVTIGFSIPRFGDRLRQWTDRRFFREAYNAEQVLSELGDHVRGMVETRSLIETVATRIANTLHVHSVAILLGGTDTYRPAFAMGYPNPPDVTFPAQTGTIKHLEKEREPARIYLDDPDSWVYRDANVTAEERNKLAQLQAELLLPLNAPDKLLGFISLGAKRSEEPYSGTDVRLLKSVATQTGLALENARLMSAIAEEVAQRERLNREVEIAREVQERLFPQTLPPIAGVTYAGACRPALGVGGDYYDFLALPEGQLGIAVGDVSGKGIAAALMMASLQASLRGEATRAPENLAALVANVNRLVYEASSSNRYATFFYAQYNPMSRLLTYVNAGHNPPILFHRNGGSWDVNRLEAGGTVVGLLANFPYEQAALKIEPGDVLIAFTDGISEAMNHADEEWGENKLIETVSSCAALAPAEIIARIMQDADTFVSGAKQHDDMTLVVLKAS